MTSLSNRPSLLSELISLPEAVSTLLENSFYNPNWSSNSSIEQNKLMTAFNIYEDDANYYILGMLPGLDPDKFELNVKENVLSVSGSYYFSNWPSSNHEQDQEQEQGETGDRTKAEGGKGKSRGSTIRTLLKEIPQGQFFRQFKLPAAFNSEQIEAHYENGLLKLLVPKVQTSQTRRIPVQIGKGKKPDFMEGQLIAAGKNK